MSRRLNLFKQFPQRVHTSQQVQADVHGAGGWHGGGGGRRAGGGRVPHLPLLQGREDL